MKVNLIYADAYKPSDVRITDERGEIVEHVQSVVVRLDAVLPPRLELTMWCPPLELKNMKPYVTEENLRRLANANGFDLVPKQ